MGRVRSGLVAAVVFGGLLVPAMTATGQEAPTEWQCAEVVENDARQFGGVDVVEATGEAVVVNSDGLPRAAARTPAPGAGRTGGDVLRALARDGGRGSEPHDDHTPDHRAATGAAGIDAAELHGPSASAIK